MNAEIEIAIEESGFYLGFNKVVAIGSKLIIATLVIWAAVFPQEAGAILGEIKTWSFARFGAWYMYVVAFFLATCTLLAVIPATGSIKLGQPDEQPDFSRFSWISMMFGAGIGIGMLTFATAEPLYHFSVNPDTILGYAQSESANNVRHAFKWSFLHWGLSAWGAYALVGLSMAFFSFNRGLPLTIRSGLAPLFGRSLNGGLGHAVDITAVIATILGVAVTIGFGVSQFAAGMYEISGAPWLMDSNGSPTNTGMLIALCVIMTASTLSALSGVSRGIKWLSNLNMWLSFTLLAFLLVFGGTSLAFKSLLIGIWDYMINLPSMLLIYWAPATAAPAAELYHWQSTSWTVFYWAWWIAFAPFVGLFLARISRGRSIREFIVGAMLAPSLMCFIWITFAGGTAIDLELNGSADGAILSAGQESQLFATLKLMLSDGLMPIMSSLVVLLLLTYLVTSADSAVLIVNTINSGGDESQKGHVHIVIWGVALTLVIAVLLIAGGMEALRTSMLVGALPFSLIMGLMGLALIKALIEDALRNREQRAND
ncbi:BCCT family transporter [Halieaceae bacterium IMCC8485]|uniref:BCCT family transporter n=1 Tax=Candidatus Seongchinamella marina TaxID=2518990 RepID=A0ABT3ST96_9GAMM|nr:BCCT family transporter [Candidatus Seongchinamella marina]MCX2973203.1 BCCT family transporter [Candidatus Seongchinamella marina]